MYKKNDFLYSGLQDNENSIVWKFYVLKNFMCEISYQTMKVKVQLV